MAKLASNVMQENAARVKRGEKPLTKAEWEKLSKTTTKTRGGDNKNGTTRKQR